MNNINFKQKYTHFVLTVLMIIFAASVFASDVIIPKSPQNVDAVLGPSGIRISWARSSDPSIIGYEVLRMTDANNYEYASFCDQSAYNSTCLVGTVSTGLFTDSATDNPIDSSRSYVYSVRSVYDADHGGVVSEWSQPISAQQKITPKLEIVNEHSVRISWGALMGGHSYAFYVYRKGGDQSSFGDIPPNTNTQCAKNVDDICYVGYSWSIFNLPDNNVTLGKTYSYRVGGYDYTTSSKIPLSNAISITLTPASPASLTASSLGRGSNKVKLTWSAPVGATSYKILRGTSIDNIALFVTSLVTTPTYTDDNAVASNKETAYFYKVIGVNSAGDSPASEIASAVSLPEALKPSAIADLINLKVDAAVKPFADKSIFDFNSTPQIISTDFVDNQNTNFGSIDVKFLTNSLYSVSGKPTITLKAISDDDISKFVVGVNPLSRIPTELKQVLDYVLGFRVTSSADQNILKSNVYFKIRIDNIADESAWRGAHLYQYVCLEHNLENELCVQYVWAIISDIPRISNGSVSFEAMSKDPRLGMFAIFGKR